MRSCINVSSKFLSVLSARRHHVLQRHQSSSQAIMCQDQDLALEDKASLYIHWPYCEKRCSYCNFNKYISKHVDDARMEKCLKTETISLIQLSGVKKITSIFFGGGTPSLASPQTLEAVLEAAATQAYLPPEAEVTIEVNPTSIEIEKMKDFKSAGINRVSIGVQALCEDDLKVLGRQHDVNDSYRCVEAAQKFFPGKTSIDLIFGRPNQTLSSWEKELKESLTICENHMSLYQLTLERGTQLFKDVEQGKHNIPDSDSMAAMYEATIETLADHDLQRYEVSNFAKTGYEGQHNMSYWNGEQYIGIGPGAHGRFVPKASGSLQREARIQTLEPNPWMMEVEKKGHGTRKCVPLSDIDIIEEILMLGLRKQDGIDEKTWQTFCKYSSLEDIFTKECVEIEALYKEGLVQYDNRCFSATAKGLNVLDSVMPMLLNLVRERLLKNEHFKNQL